MASGGPSRQLRAVMHNCLMFTGWHQSLWADHTSPPVGESLSHDEDCDVAIIGAGFTGLWTAYYLRAIAPSLRITIVDANQPGFGASGRNGGWCSALFPVSLDSIARSTSREAAISMQRELFSTVRDMGDAISASNIDCDWTLAGSLTAATNPVHLGRLQRSIDEFRRFGFGDEDLRELSRDDLSHRIAVSRSYGATFTPHCAVIHPLKLVNGLVDHLVTSGVTFRTMTHVTSFNTGQVKAHSTHGEFTIAADWVVQATEGFSRSLPGQRRNLIPFYSYMVATEPLSDDVWQSIGWSGRETFADARNMVIYAQRTADNRIAFGGRGAHYRYASAISPEHESNRMVHRRIVQTMHDLFPATRDAAITHRWGGPLGMPRDWHPAVSFNPDRHIASAGGYVGDGVATSHLAGRTLAELMTGTESPRTSLPWVNHRRPKWEPEPIRWVGVNSLLQLPNIADRHEERTERPSRLIDSVLARFLG